VGLLLVVRGNSSLRTFLERFEEQERNTEHTHKKYNREDEKKIETLASMLLQSPPISTSFFYLLQNVLVSSSFSKERNPFLEFLVCRMWTRNYVNGGGTHLDLKIYLSICISFNFHFVYFNSNYSNTVLCKM